jgi:branched-chain amino acid transport system permease protein
MTSVLDVAGRRFNAELVEDRRVRRGAYAVAAVLVFYWLVDRLWDVPFGVLVKGAVIGGLYSMIALGIALVYRANRIINFAQGDLGGVPASLAVLLIAVSGWPYLAAIGLGLVGGVLLGAVVEFLVIRRFAKSPRLVLTVATIGIAQLLTFLEIYMPHWFNATTPPQSFPSPFNFSFGITGVRFQGNDVLAMLMVPTVLVLIAWFLNRTHIGVAIRACSESADRASLLGVPVRRVNLVVWSVAALLATVGVLLRAGVVGLPIGSPLGVSVLMRTLAAAVVGRMERMPVIVAASIGLGVVEQAAVWHTGNTDVVDLVIFIVILAALLLRRREFASRIQEAATSTWTALREVRPVPPELAGLREVMWARRAVVTVVVAVVLLLPAMMGEAKLDLATFLAAYLIIALSLLVLSGWAGQISLGQFAFVAVGSNVGAWLTLHWHMDVLLVMVVSGGIGALVAVAIGIPALRIRGLFLAAATLAFTFAANDYFLSSGHFSWIPDQFTTVPRLPVFGRLSLDSADRFYYFSYAVLLMCVVAVRGLRRSRIGRVLVATRENERGVQAYGVNVTRAKLVAFAFSGFLAAVAGVLILYGQTALYPGGADPESSIGAFVMVVIGGLGSITGVFAGAIYLEGLTWFRGDVPQALQGVMSVLGSGIGLILILIFLPGGVGSLVYQVRDRLLRYVADRRGIVVPSLIADAQVRNDATADTVIEQADPDALTAAYPDDEHEMAAVSP